VKWKLAEETKILGENPLQFHFIPQKFHMTIYRTEFGSLKLEADSQLPELIAFPASGIMKNTAQV
jgi:hypothetical protein